MTSEKDKTEGSLVIRILLAFIAILGPIGAAYVVNRQNIVDVAMNGPQKVCRVVIPGDGGDNYGWTDSIIVPSTWTSDTCDRFMSSVGGRDYELGCASAKGFAWGRNNGHKAPDENTCGW
jgi:hypothetical protein